MLLSLLLSAAPAPTDTLIVEKTHEACRQTVQAVYQTDSLSPSGKTYDIQEMLERNAHLAATHPGESVSKQAVISYGEALTESADSLPVLRVIRFSADTESYAKARLDVQGLSHYKFYAAGAECASKEFALSPGRTDFSLLILTTKTDKDTLRLRLMGENLQGKVTINVTGKRAYTMTDMTQGERYRSVRLSPSGKYIVVVKANIQRDGSAIYSTQLAEVATGRTLMQRDEYAQWDWLAGAEDILYYTRKGASGRELLTYAPATGKAQVVATNIPEGSFTIAPRADYLIYNKSEEGTNSKKGLKKLENPDDRMPGWRTRNELWRFDVKTGVMQRLTYGNTNVLLADIAADGSKLLLQYSRFDARKTPFDRTTLVEMDASTGKVDTLLADTIFISTAKFSPDANQLLILASPAAFDGIGSEVAEGQTPNAFDYRLYLYDKKEKVTTPLLCDFAPSVEDYTWSRGDGNIYFVATDGADRSLFRLNPRTEQVVRYQLPVSYIQDFTIAENVKTPRCLFFGQTAERARELFSVELGNGSRPAAKRCGTIDFDALYKGVAIGTCHDWNFQASRGDTIHGFYFLPPDFDGAKRYPVIVYYYGGCTPTSKCLEFQYPLQVLAGQGYVVYVCNPSGAIGYGQEFAARHVGTWGEQSGDDIIEGTKGFLAAHPYCDGKRVGCMGASYGGFMTQYLQTRTDSLFACAVSHAGISNIASYWGGGYWGYSYGEAAQYGSYPWNNPDLYVEHSPLFNADKIHTPLLLLHGTADTNVPTNESQQLYIALKILGRDVTYVQVDGENHVITNYAKRLAWQETIFAWFAKYLKGDATWWDNLEF